MATPILPPPPPRKAWSNRLTILAALTLVLGPMTIFSFVPGEIARWHAAAAQEAAWSNDHTTAIAQLDRAIAWQPENVDWRLMRAEQQLAAGNREEAVDSCRRAIALDTANQATLHNLSTLCLKLQLHDEAIAVSRRALGLAKRAGVDEHTQALNGLAYTLAVANRDLEEASRLINEALEAEPESPSLLDTRAYLRYRLGQHQQARVDADKAVAGWSRIIPLAEAGTRMQAADERQLNLKSRKLREVHAVLLYHRALVLEKLGLEPEAAFDRARVRELGFTPDESLF